MSYCRFSSDDFGCDVYVYASEFGGFVTHVAQTRIVGVVPPLPELTPENATGAFYQVRGKPRRSGRG